MSRRHTRIPPWRKAKLDAEQAAADRQARQRLGVLFGFEDEKLSDDSQGKDKDAAPDGDAGTRPDRHEAD
jgi:hypothetical protein